MESSCEGAIGKDSVSPWWAAGGGSGSHGHVSHLFGGEVLGVAGRKETEGSSSRSTGCIQAHGVSLQSRADRWGSLGVHLISVRQCLSLQTWWVCYWLRHFPFLLRKVFPTRIPLLSSHMWVDSGVHADVPRSVWSLTRWRCPVSV